MKQRSDRRVRETGKGACVQVLYTTELLTAACVSLGGVPRVIVDVGDVPEIAWKQRETGSVSSCVSTFICILVPFRICIRPFFGHDFVSRCNVARSRMQSRKSTRVAWRILRRRRTVSTSQEFNWNGSLWFTVDCFKLTTCANLNEAGPLCKVIRNRDRSAAEIKFIRTNAEGLRMRKGHATNNCYFLPDLPRFWIMEQFNVSQD